MTDSALIVLGMHRSGTSALTGALRLLGVHLGNDLLKATEANSSGYWEHAGIVEAHDRIFRILRSAWDEYFPLPERWWDQPELEIEVREIGRMVHDTFAGSGIWGLKDPRMCRLMPFWKELLEKHQVRPKYLLTTRSPLEVAASLARRDGFSYHKSAMLWIHHVLEIDHETRGQKRVWIPYRRLLQDPEATFNRIGSALDITWQRPWQDAGEEVASFLNPAMRHHRANKDNRDHGFAMNRALQMFAMLDQEAEPEEHYDTLDAWHEEWRGMLSLSGESVRAMRGEMVNLAREIETARQAHSIRDERELSLRIETQEMDMVLKENGIAMPAALFSRARRSPKWSRIIQALRNMGQPDAHRAAIEEAGNDYWNPSHRSSVKRVETHHLSLTELIPEMAELTDLLTDSIYAFVKQVSGDANDDPSDVEADGKKALNIADSLDLIGLLKEIDQVFQMGTQYLQKQKKGFAEFGTLKSSHDKIEAEIAQARLNMHDLEGQIAASKASHAERDRLESLLREALSEREQEIERARESYALLQARIAKVEETSPQNPSEPSFSRILSRIHSAWDSLSHLTAHIERARSLGQSLSSQISETKLHIHELESLLLAATHHHDGNLPLEDSLQQVASMRDAELTEISRVLELLRASQSDNENEAGIPDFSEGSPLHEKLTHMMETLTRHQENSKPVRGEFLVYRQRITDEIEIRSQLADAFEALHEQLRRAQNELSDMRVQVGNHQDALNQEFGVGNSEEGEGDR